MILSPLGVVTGDILADIILGNVNPSGKLSSTWASAKDYRYIEESGGIDNVRYIEGVYVGYRYFDTANVKPLYAFGYGKSYTDFNIEKLLISNRKEKISIKLKVDNTGKYVGKEVVQVYVSPSQENKSKPYQSLVAFQKTKDLLPGESQVLTITFNIKDASRYDEKSSSFILDKGKYIVRVGNSSDNTKVYCVIVLEEDVIIEKLKNVGGKTDFGELELDVKYKDNLSNIDLITLSKTDISAKEVKYDYTPKYNDFVKSLKIEDAAKMCLSETIGEVSELEKNMV